MVRRITDYRLRIRKMKSFDLVFDNKGMTLLEIAISMAILAITLVTLANFFPIGLKASRRASNFSEAGILAQRVIDNIKRAAAVYDNGDSGIYDVAHPEYMSNGDGVGYFELVVWDEYAPPYYDEEADSGLVSPPPPPSQFDSTSWRYQYPNMNMYAVVTKESLDINGLYGIEPWEIKQKKQHQKIHVAVYWKEGEVERADTFVTYIANPFYEKYK